MLVSSTTTTSFFSTLKTTLQLNYMYVGQASFVVAPAAAAAAVVRATFDTLSVCSLFVCGVSGAAQLSTCQTDPTN